MRNNVVASLAKLFLIFVGVYFFELATFPLSIDEELAAYRTDPAVWVHQGRWASYLFELFILPRPTLPVVPPAIFGVTIAASYMFILQLVSGRRRLRTADYLLFVIFCGYPTWFFLVEFYSNIAAVGLGVLACTISTWLTLSEKRHSFPGGALVGAAVLGAFAIGIYQSLLFLLIAQGCGVVLLCDFTRIAPMRWRELAKVALVAAGSILLYFCADVVFRLLFPGKDAYVDSLLNPQMLLSSPGVVIRNTLNAVSGAYGLTTQVFREPMWGAALVLMCGVAAAIGRWRSENRRALILWVGCALIVLLAPFSLHLLSGGNFPTRSLVAVSFAVWLFGYLAVYSPQRTLAIAGTASVALTSFQLIVVGNRYQASSYFLARHDLALAAALEDRISASPGFDPAKVYALVVFGGLPFSNGYPPPRSSTIGGSFFAWDGGSPARIVPYMRLFGWNNLSVPTVAQQDRVFEKLSAFPVWPAEGSVQLDGDVILVRLAKNPSVADRAILKRIKESRKSTQAP
jgi:hypothetical protein